MSYEAKEMPEWAGAILGLFTVAAVIWSIGNLFVWFMGPCPAFSSNQSCEWSQTKELWYFPGSQIATLIMVIAAVKVFRKAFSK